MRNWWIVVAGLAIGAPAAAQEGAEASTELGSSAAKDELRRKVDVLLSGIERTATDADWAALGEGAVPVLIERMNDDEEKIVRRGRAAIGLGFFRTPAVSTALRAVVTDTSSPTLLLRKGIVALARVDGERALDVLEPHLEHRSSRVREDAIKAIGAMATVRARALLEPRVATEPSTHLRDLLKTELARPATAVDTSLTGVKP